jgi:hypothetical protein
MTRTNKQELIIDTFQFILYTISVGAEELFWADKIIL